MVLALFGFTWMFQCIMFLFLFLACYCFVCLFLSFFKRFIILQLSCGNYEAVACKISLSHTVVVCRQDLQWCFVIFPVLMFLGNGVSHCHCDTLAYVLFTESMGLVAWNKVEWMNEYYRHRPSPKLRLPCLNLNLIADACVCT